MEFVEAVSRYRNGETEYCEQIILYHIPLIKKIARRYVSLPRYPYEDIVEIAQFALVNIVMEAPAKLRDNNIKYFIISRVRYAIMEYISSDHLIFGSRNSKNRERIKFKDVHCTAEKPFDKLVFWEAVENSITNERMADIVNLKLKGHTFKEITALTPGTYEMAIVRIWKVFVNNMRQNYSENAFL
jgi:hypothetical protein